MQSNNSLSIITTVHTESTKVTSKGGKVKANKENYNALSDSKKSKWNKIKNVVKAINSLRNPEIIKITNSVGLQLPFFYI